MIKVTAYAPSYYSISLFSQQIKDALQNLRLVKLRLA